MAKKIKEEELEVKSDVLSGNYRFVVIKTSQHLKEGDEYEGSAEMVNVFLKKGWIKLI